MDEAGSRGVNVNPNSFRIVLLHSCPMSMSSIKQARSALNRSESLMRESLASLPERSVDEVDALADSLKAPLTRQSFESFWQSLQPMSMTGLPVGEG